MAEAVEIYYEELKAFVTRRTGSAALAADIMQETWLRAALASPAEPVVNPRAYVYRVADHIALDHLRRDRVAARRDAGPAAEALADPQPGPEQSLAARQELEILCAAVEALPAKCRTAFLLYRGRGLSMRQVAAAMTISEKTVEKHIAKAMVHCRRRLREASGAD